MNRSTIGDTAEKSRRRGGAVRWVVLVLAPASVPVLAAPAGAVVVVVGVLLVASDRSPGHVPSVVPDVVPDVVPGVGGGTLVVVLVAVVGAAPAGPAPLATFDPDSSPSSPTQPAAHAPASRSIASRRAGRRVEVASNIERTVGVGIDAIPFAHGSPGAVASPRPVVSGAGRRDDSPWQADRMGATVLLILTAVAGGLDAIAFLALGGTFVSNQTGTVLILGMAVSGTADVRVVLGVVSLGSFLAGAALAGRVLPVTAAGERWPRHLRTMILAEAALIAACAALASFDDVDRAVVLAPAALAMGAQAALARRVGLSYLATGFITGAVAAGAMVSPLGDRSTSWWWFAIIPVSVLVAGAAAASSVNRISTELALAMLGVLTLVAGALTALRPIQLPAA
jgi:uncharacterized membrane protein YoaK (UPF0700 family)